MKFAGMQVSKVLSLEELLGCRTDFVRCFLRCLVDRFGYLFVVCCML